MTEEKQKSNKKTIPMLPFQLSDIRLYEIIVRRCDQNTDKIKPIPISIELSSTEEVNVEEFPLLLTFKAGFPLEEKPTCDIELSIEGIFHLLEGVEKPKAEVIKRFMNKDAMVLFWPYLRQNLHDITEKMRLGMTPLPILNPSALIDMFND